MLLLVSFHAVFAQWSPMQKIQPTMINALQGLRIPVTTSKISPWSDRDSIGQITFDPTAVKFYGRFTTTSFKALASEDSVLRRWDSTKVKSYVSFVTGGGSSLQTTTGVGNTTANTIAVTGSNKFTDSTGTHIWNGELLFGNPVAGTYASGFIEAASLSMNMTNNLNVDAINTINIRANGAGQVVNIRGLGGVNIGITGGTPTTFLGRAAGQKAIFSTEYVRKDQMDSVGHASPGTVTFTGSGSVNTTLGIGYTINITGDGDHYNIIINTGTPITTSGTVGTFNLPVAFSSNPIVVWSPGNVTASNLATVGMNATSTSTVVMFTTTQFLPNSTYIYNVNAGL